MTNHRVASALIALLCAIGWSPAVEADDPGSEAPDSADSGGEAPSAEEPSSEFSRLMDEGRNAYNDSKWKRAAQLYRRAAQVAPERPAAYRNLARAHFMNENYARAATLYEQYLELAPASADTSRIERERKLATHRAGEDVWTRPDSQKRVLEALRDALTEGEAYTEGGGGAWALYKALLRTGYVHPDLGHIQTRLRERLLEEFKQRATPESDQPTPVLSLQDWQRQQRRLEAARSLTGDSEVRSKIDDRMRIVETALALLNGRSEEAAEHAASAREANPDMDVLRWFEVAALVGAEQYDRAEERLDAVSAETEDLSESKRRYLQALRAIVAHRRGDAGAAADLYRRVLR